MSFDQDLVSVAATGPSVAKAHGIAAQKWVIHCVRNNECWHSFVQFGGIEMRGAEEKITVIKTITKTHQKTGAKRRAGQTASPSWERGYPTRWSRSRWPCSLKGGCLACRTPLNKNRKLDRLKYNSSRSGHLPLQTVYYFLIRGKGIFTTFLSVFPWIMPMTLLADCIAVYVIAPLALARPLGTYMRRCTKTNR